MCFRRTETIEGDADEVFKFYGGAWVGPELGAGTFIWPKLGGPPGTGALAAALDEMESPLGAPPGRTRKVTLYAPPGTGPGTKTLVETMTKQDAKTRTLQCILPGTQTLVFPCCTPLCSAHCPSVHLPNTRVRVHVWKDHILGTAINRVWGDDWIHTIFGGLKYDSLVIDFTTSPKGKGVCEIKWMVAAMVSNLDLANAALNAFYDAFTGKMHQNFTLTDTLEYSRTEKIPGSADDVWSYYGGAFIGAELGASPSIWPTLGGPPSFGCSCGCS